MADFAVGSKPIGEFKAGRKQSTSDVVGVKSNGQVVDGNGNALTTGVSTTPVPGNDSVADPNAVDIKKGLNPDAGPTSVLNPHQSA